MTDQEKQQNEELVFNFNLDLDSFNPEIVMDTPGVKKEQDRSITETY